MTHHLLCNHHNSLDREFAVAMVEEILQAGSEKVDDQDVVEALLAEVIHIRDTGYTLSAFIRPTMKSERGVTAVRAPKPR